MKHPTCLANRRPEMKPSRLPNRLHGGQERLHSGKKGTASWCNGIYHYAVCNHLLGACNRQCNRFERPGALATTGRVTGVTTFSEKYRVRARREHIEKVFGKGGYIRNMGVARRPSLCGCPVVARRIPGLTNT